VDEEEDDEGVEMSMPRRRRKYRPDGDGQIFIGRGVIKAYLFSNAFISIIDFEGGIRVLHKVSFTGCVLRGNSIFSVCGMSPSLEIVVDCVLTIPRSSLHTHT